MPRFVDTNVLLYATSDDPTEAAKAERANLILTSRDLAVSAQVLQEFYVQVTRTSREKPSTHEGARLFVESMRRFPTQPITAGIVLAAIAAHHRYKISYWDAAIIEAARVLGCEVVLSEDLNDGQDYGGVRVENPFGAVPDP